MKLINGCYINDIAGETLDVFYKESVDVGNRLVRNYNFALNTDPTVSNIYLIRLFVSYVQWGAKSYQLFDQVFKRLDKLKYNNKKDVIVFILQEEGKSEFNTFVYNAISVLRPDFSLENIYFADEQLNDAVSSEPCLKHLNFVSQSGLAQLVDIRHYISKKDRLFLTFNRRLKDHRVMLAGRLIEEGLLDQTLLSFYARCEGMTVKAVVNGCGYLTDQEKQRYLKLLDHDFLLDSDKTAIERNAQAPSSAAVTELHRRSYFSVICETKFDEPEIAVTEKTYKAIAHRHPFIIVGQCDFLKYLRTLGYKTFSPWINESYDDIQDHKLRFEAVIAELKRLAALPKEQLNAIYQEILKIADYNYRIHNNNFSYIDTEVTTLFNFINKFDSTLTAEQRRQFKFTEYDRILELQQQVNTSKNSGGILKMKKIK